MSRTYLLAGLLAILLLLGACREDIDETIDVSTDIPPTIEVVTASLAGVVSNPDGTPAAGVEVAAVGPNGAFAFTTTDASGRWTFTDATLPAEGVTVRFREGDVREEERRFDTDEGITAYYPVRFFDAARASTLTSDESVDLNAGRVDASLDAPAYLLDGEPYRGSVRFALNEIAHSRATAASVPQPFVLEDGSTFIPTTLYLAQATTTQARNLRLADATPLDLTVANLGGEESLYHYNLSAGQWELVEFSNGGFEAGQLGYFALGSRSTGVSITGRLIDQGGSPIVGSSVFAVGFDATAQDSLYFEEALSNSLGVFELLPPIGTQILIFTGVNDCSGDVVVADSSGDQNLGDLTITPFEVSPVTGSVLDCNGDPVTEAFTIEYEVANQTYTTSTAADGSYAFDLETCGNESFTIRAIAASGNTSRTLSLDRDALDGSPLDITFCIRNPARLGATVIIDYEDGAVDTIRFDSLRASENDGTYTFTLFNEDDNPDHVVRIMPHDTDPTLFTLGVFSVATSTAFGSDEETVDSYVVDDGTFVTGNWTYGPIDVFDVPTQTRRRGTVTIDIVAAL